MFCIFCFFHNPEGSSLTARSGVDGPDDVSKMKNESAWKCHGDLHGSQCCVGTLHCPVGNTANQADKRCNILCNNGSGVTLCCSALTVTVCPTTVSKK